MQKEQYFTSEILDKKSQELLAYVSSLRDKHREDRFFPGCAALLVLDMQDYFLQPESHAYIPSASSIVAGISRLCSAFLAANRPVVFTRHINTAKNAGKMSVWWKELILPHDAHSQITHELDVSNCILIEKGQYDAFLRTPLKAMLRRLGIKQVVVTGVMTHLCCETTARSAFMHGFDVFFTVDGTATYTEALHRASLLTLSHGFAIPMLVKEVELALHD